MDAREVHRRQTLGAHAEERAKSWVLQQGWTLLATNLRVGAAQIDIVALDGNTLVALEVKAIIGRADALSRITLAQGRRLLDALAQWRPDTIARVDLLAVRGEEIEHYRDVMAL